MRADAAARDRQLTQRMDESHTRLRDEFQSRDDRLIQSLTDAMDRRMLQMFAFCRDESRDGPFDRPPRGPPDPPPTAKMWRDFLYTWICIIHDVVLF